MDIIFHFQDGDYELGWLCFATGTSELTGFLYNFSYSDLTPQEPNEKIFVDDVMVIDPNEGSEFSGEEEGEQDDDEEEGEEEMSLDDVEELAADLDLDPEDDLKVKQKKK